MVDVAKVIVDKTNDTKLKILCLHGYRQTGEIFRERTGAFRKLSKKVAEFVFVSAPNIVPKQDSDDTATTETRGWWFSREDDYFHASDTTDWCKGFDASLDELRKIFREQGPFDGVLGFSQGATMAALLCVVKETQPESEISFKFAILIAGFVSRSSYHTDLHQHRISCPTLHVYGDTDNVIPREMSEALQSTCSSTTVIRHPGGHFVPTTSQQKSAYLDFFTKIKDLT